MDRRSVIKSFALLLGGSISLGLNRSLMAGVDMEGPVTKPVLSDPQRQLCYTLAEMVIPTTDTPGAIEAGVPQFIELIVSDWYTDREREIFIDGLDRIEALAQEHYGLEFNDCVADNQIEMLEQMEREALAYEPPAADRVLSGTIGVQIDESEPFFYKLRELTVIGYYTSEVGATQEHRYNPVPIHHKEIPLADVGRQWSY